MSLRRFLVPVAGLLVLLMATLSLACIYPEPGYWHGRYHGHEGWRDSGYHRYW